MSNKIKKRPANAMKKAPVDPGPTLQEALRLHRQGLLAEAEALYRQLLAVQPGHSDALNLLATLCQQQGDFPKAIALLEKAIALKPDRPDYHSNLGSAYRGINQQRQAITAFGKALALHPGHLESEFNRALCHLELGELEVAAQGFQHFLRSKPAFIPAHELLARTLIGRGLVDAAVATFQEIVRLDPGHHGAYCEIGNLLQAQGRLTEAVAAYQQAIALAPASAVAHNNLGNTLAKQGKLHAALSCYQEAIRCNPDLGEAHVNLSWTYKGHGMIAESERSLQRYLDRHPGDRKAHSDLLFHMNYDPTFTPKQLLQAAKGWWQRHRPRGHAALFVHPTREPSSRLRIGFLSPDFKTHPVGTFLLPLFAAMDQQQASLHCYAEMRDRQLDAVSHRLKAQAATWFSTAGLSAHEAASRIHQDQLDILIDLAGHSANNRLDIMALRPAPVQVSWLGYVNTTGLPVIDYRLSDAVADPPGMEPYYSERLLRLPDAFFCYEPPSLAPEIGPLPALIGNAITLGSLNNPAKITEEVIALWAKLLLQLPGARLIMVGAPFADEFVSGRYLDLFANHGVEPSRIELIASLPMEEYLNLYNRIDIALDPFPHNGHTITCHTLWMGVPVITLAGDRYAARMGASVLNGVGLPEHIAHTPEEYLTITTTLARDLDRLAALRQSLRERLRHSVICDTSRFANHFLQTMHAIRATARQVK